MSYVGATGLNIDGNVKTNHDGNPFGPSDIALFSFSCNGTYRWSKIIGGNGANETVNAVCVDAQDNVYIAGRLGQCGDPNYPPRIDDDVVISQSPMDCRPMFIAKYNTNGALQWIKQPQPVGTPQNEISTTSSSALLIDNAGNLNWIVLLGPGVYADGAFVNNQPGVNFFILKYDTNGTYIGNTPLNIQLTGGYSTIKFYYNPYNGFYYFVGEKSDNTATAVVGGTTINQFVFIACFNAQGVFQWVREDTFPDANYMFIYNLAFDPQNNIYIGGLIAGFNFGSFLGFSVSETIIPGFVLKTNPDASQLLWSSYNNKGSQNRGAIALNGNELAYTSYGFGVDFTWGTQTLNISGPNQGQEAILARFNKDTGACIGLTKVPGSLGFNDHGAALTVDASSDYILGGYMGGTLFFDNNQQITNIGSQSDFFVAKYATEPCQPLSVADQGEKRIIMHPNPTRDLVTFDNSQAGIARVSVYNYLGQEVLLPINCNGLPEVTIDMSGLSSGVYLVRLEGSGVSSTVKVMRE
ncbi:MAG TPA: T9SS type A sorting domain-containing protein [Flavobacterium sp.]|nr:T9SS type A sorting domain-containing protein [Flavobacterium sp.]